MEDGTSSLNLKPPKFKLEVLNGWKNGCSARKNLVRNEDDDKPDKTKLQMADTTAKMFAAMHRLERIFFVKI